MNIAVDIDDTLTESFAYFQPCVAEYFGADIEELRRKKISYGNLPDAWKADELRFCQTYYDRLVPDTPFKPDAAWAVRKLKEQGHRIVIITARTAAFYTDPYQTTREELRRGGIPYDKLICTFDKGAACAEEHIDLLIDDVPANCDAARERGVSTLLFTSEANRETASEHTRVSSWSEVLEHINQAALQPRQRTSPITIS